MNELPRRDTLRHLAWFSLAMALDHPPIATAAPPAAGDLNHWAHSSNFKAIYQDPTLKAAFLLFLRNVYNLYPEDRFHQLIDRATRSGQSDREIYLQIQSQLSTITPFLSEIRYALPALSRQKEEMTRQTLALLGRHKSIRGYLEIGTTGRYVAKLQSQLGITGDIVLLNTAAPSYSPVDIAERGQPAKIGRFVSLNDYQPIASRDIPDSSLDLIGNYIGIHHSPPERRDAFVRSMHRVLRPGGRLVLRDHDVNSPQMNHMVALAHDVFNAGLGAPWAINQQEIRNFTSMAELTAYLARFGFALNERSQPLLQPGDPTRNTLAEFVKI